MRNLRDAFLDGQVDGRSQGWHDGYLAGFGVGAIGITFPALALFVAGPLWGVGACIVAVLSSGWVAEKAAPKSYLDHILEKERQS